MQSDLIEREAELAALDEALAAASSGTGRLLVIEAAPGVGKTRLLRTLQDRASARILKARGSELESKFAFGVVHQLLDAVVLAAPDSAFDGAARLAQPIFTEGVDHWRNYEPWLESLKTALGPIVASYPQSPVF